MPLNRRPLLLLLVLAIAVGAATGCAKRHRGLPPVFENYQPPQSFEPHFARLEREGQRNWVLNLQTIAIGAIAARQLDLARLALDEAILQIEIIYGDSPQARRARSTFYTEDSKIFKGDPYERSMIYFYRGVLYMQERNWDNARACFRSAALMDAFAEDEQDRDDWTIFDLMIAACEYQMNNPVAARGALGRAEQRFADFARRYPMLSAARSGSRSRFPIPTRIPQITADTNLIVITLHGNAPQKAPAGRYGQEIVILPGGGTPGGAAVTLDGEHLGITSIVDSVYFQAVTRGGREIDTLLRRQAKLRGTAADVGEVAGRVGLWTALYTLDAEDKRVPLIAAGVALVGAGIYGLSTLVRPEADVRAMESLPDALGVLTATRPPHARTLEIDYTPVPADWNGSRRTTVTLPGDDSLHVILVFPPPHPVAVGP